MKYLGLDLGSRTCGVAISDALGMFARTYETIRFSDDDYEFAAKRVVEIANKEGITEVVLGMPKHMNGDLGIRAEISIKFKENLLSKGIKEVHLIDERLTTVEADEIMDEAGIRGRERKEYVDMIAAQIILQDYLDNRDKE